MGNPTTINYSPLGCYNNSNTNTLSNTTSNNTSQNYTQKQCQQKAVNNNSAIFGLQDINNGLGKCFLSNHNLSIPDQINNAIKGGKANNFSALNKCNNTYLYANEAAFTFFNDLNVDTPDEEIINYYNNLVNNLNQEFTSAYANLKNKSEEKMNVVPYGEHNFTEILIQSGYNEIKQIIDKYYNLIFELNSKTDNLDEAINELNINISELDEQKNLAEKKLNSLLNSNNAALGLHKDTQNLSNLYISENVILIIIIIIFIIFFYKKNKN